MPEKKFLPTRYTWSPVRYDQDIKIGFKIFYHIEGAFIYHVGGNIRKANRASQLKEVDSARTRERRREG